MVNNITEIKKLFEDLISELKKSIISGDFTDNIDDVADRLKENKKILDAYLRNNKLSEEDNYEFQSLIKISWFLNKTMQIYKIDEICKIYDDLDYLINYCNSRIIESGSSISEIIENPNISNFKKITIIRGLILTYLASMNEIIMWKKNISKEDNNKESFLKIIDFITVILTDYVNNKEKFKYLFDDNKISDKMKTDCELIDIYSDIIKTIVLNNMEMENYNG